MPVYKLPTHKGCWFFSFSKKGKRYKREKWQGEYMTSKTMAQACEEEFKRQLKAMEYLNADITTTELFDQFVANTKGNLKASTINNYDKFKRLYLIYLKEKTITELTPHDVIKFRISISQLDISSENKNRILGTTKAMLSYGQLMYDLTGKLQVPLLEPFKEIKVEKEKKEVYLPLDKFESFIDPLDDINDFYYKTVIKVLYYTGLRIGELASLTYADIKNGYIDVNKDYIRVGSQDIIQKPKNQNSVRIIPLNDDMVILLNEYCNKYNITKDNEIVFKYKGSYLNQQRIRRVLNKLNQFDEFKDYDIHPHSLRHSFNTNLKNAGVDVYTRAKLLGNTPDVNADTYTHTEFKELENAVKLIKN